MGELMYNFSIFLFGVWEVSLSILVCIMMLDYGTGMLRAYYMRDFDSRFGINGVIRKMSMLVAVIIANFADLLLMDGATPVFRSLTVLMLIGNEAISIIENLSMMGVDLPDKLINKFRKMKDGKSKDINKDIKSNKKNKGI